jgi:hypothetical protein
MKPSSDFLSALSVALLLILTAWGNADAMLLCSAAGLLVGAFFFRKHIRRGGVLAMIAAFITSIAISLFIKLK